MGPIVLLGPQRLRPILADVVADLKVAGRIATVTAGWQEREEEDDELAEHLSGRTVNLRLHRRAERVFESDPELAEAYRERQLVLKHAQALYRVRLEHAMAAVRDLMRRKDEPELLVAEQRASFEAVRRLDSGHLERIRKIHTDFVKQWSPLKRPAVRKQRRKLADQLSGCEAVAVAGGHVAVLLNRLRLFGLAQLFGDLPVLAWSAGAMALSRRVVLFHDFPPQGFGNAEVLEAGLGFFDRILPLPHARRRIHLDEPNRVAELARRFAPRICVPMDEGDYLKIDGPALWAEAPLRRLTPEGRVEHLELGE